MQVIWCGSGRSQLSRIPSPGLACSLLPQTFIVLGVPQGLLMTLSPLQCSKSLFLLWLERGRRGSRKKGHGKRRWGRKKTSAHNWTMIMLHHVSTNCQRSCKRWRVVTHGDTRSPNLHLQHLAWGPGARIWKELLPGRLGYSRVTTRKNSTRRSCWEDPLWVIRSAISWPPVPFWHVQS